jgi:tetratricopeptide (TPR) repeat protein
MCPRAGHRLLCSVRLSPCGLAPECPIRPPRRVLQRDSSHVLAMDGMAEALIDCGQPEQAQLLVKRSLELAPDAGGQKWLLYAQTLEGKDALEAFARGTTLLESQQAAVLASGDETQGKHLSRQVASAYCSVAELYLTDLCYESNAEVACEAAVTRGLAADPLNAELHATFAQLRACQQRPGDARGALREALRLVCAAMVRDRGTMDDDDEDMGPSSSTSPAAVSSSSAVAETGEGPSLPSFEARFAMAQAAIELGGGEAGKVSGIYSDVVPVLEGLVEEDDECWEAWFRLAQALAGSEDTEGALDTLSLVSRLLVETMSQAAGRDLAEGEGGATAREPGPARDDALEKLARKLAVLPPSELPQAAQVGEENAERIRSCHHALVLMMQFWLALSEGKWERPGPPAGEDDGAAAAAANAMADDEESAAAASSSSA